MKSRIVLERAARGVARMRLLAHDAAESVAPARSFLPCEQRIAAQLELAQAQAAPHPEDSARRHDRRRIDGLERNVQQARSEVVTYGRKREEARLLTQLDMGNFSDISVPPSSLHVFRQVASQRNAMWMLSVWVRWVRACCSPAAGRPWGAAPMAAPMNAAPVNIDGRAFAMPDPTASEPFTVSRPPCEQNKVTSSNECSRSDRRRGVAD